MNQIFNQSMSLQYLNLDRAPNIHYQLSPAELVELAIYHQEGTLADSGALVVDTGEFTGRSPRDRFIVSDDLTEKIVWWGNVNIPMSTDQFDKLLYKVTDYLCTKTIYVRDGCVCADPKYKLSLRIVTEQAFQNLFAHHLFLRPDQAHLEKQPEWTIISAPFFHAVPAEDGTRKHNFSIINFSRKIILIGGTAYTGEIKKGVFSVLNFLLPQNHQVLSMHCAANVGLAGDTAIFFGLSGTGKTSLSTDAHRALVGDDEHGWSADAIFNFEGGCYAKCANLVPEKEPEILRAIQFGSLLENTVYYENTRAVQFDNISKTENTRAAYPIHYIENVLIPSIAPIPKNIFFLTADAFAVLPPIARLNMEQAMYYFISGYTAKVSGTEAGILEPQATFSPCFAKAFLPIHPIKYAKLLGDRIKNNPVKVWLVNTGWTGGPYGLGSRMQISITRVIIAAALKGELDSVDFEEHPIFGLMMPLSCPGVPSEILNPKHTWLDKDAYDQQALELANAFVLNFKQFAEFAGEDILSNGPRVAARV